MLIGFSKENNYKVCKPLETKQNNAKERTKTNRNNQNKKKQTETPHKLQNSQHQKTRATLKKTNSMQTKPQKNARKTQKNIKNLNHLNLKTSNKTRTGTFNTGQRDHAILCLGFADHLQNAERVSSRGLFWTFFCPLFFKKQISHCFFLVRYWTHCAKFLRHCVVVAVGCMFSLFLHNDLIHCYDNDMTLIDNLCGWSESDDVYR